jgi:hypothetical protein
VQDLRLCEDCVNIFPSEHLPLLNTKAVHADGKSPDGAGATTNRPHGDAPLVVVTGKLEQGVRVFKYNFALSFRHIDSLLHDLGENEPYRDRAEQ